MSDLQARLSHLLAILDERRKALEKLSKDLDDIKQKLH